MERSTANLSEGPWQGPLSVSDALLIRFAISQLCVRELLSRATGDAVGR